MEIIQWGMLGLVLGAVSRLFMPGRGPDGIVATMTLGIIGSVVGGLLGRILGMSSSIVMAFVSAAFFLFVYRLSLGGRRGT